MWKDWSIRGLFINKYCKVLELVSSSTALGTSTVSIRDAE